MDDEDIFGDVTPKAEEQEQEEQQQEEVQENPLEREEVQENPLENQEEQEVPEKEVEQEEPKQEEQEEQKEQEEEEEDSTPAIIESQSTKSDEQAKAQSNERSSTSFAEVKLKPSEVLTSLFDISVGAPEKKGDGMNAYVVYTINTKTTAPEFENPSMSVSRRFTNFVWLYTQLTSKYPGIIVPPIPEKQALGRFGTEFLDHRRAFLEKCLKRIAAHSVLSKSPDFKLFLESSDLENDIKKREPKKGFFSSISNSMTGAVSSAASTFQKIQEPDEWFENKKAQVEVFESQLKSLYKFLEIFLKQRRDLASANGDFGDHISSLGSSESNKPLAESLNNLGELQKKIKEAQIQQAVSDEQYLNDLVEEYLKIIESTKVALNARVKAYGVWKSSSEALTKKKEQLTKMSAQGKTPKVTALEAEIEESEKNVEKNKQSFDDITELLRNELARFDQEKIEDFHAGLSGFVESMIKTQRNTVDLWQDYLPQVQSL